jgi:phytoene dehydrogenase-like protein
LRWLLDMETRHVVIIGGGLAGLSAGCYALRNGFRTTIVEHNLALGGVCTAWQRGPYLIDGCIHWLTGGPFQRLYTELDILPELKLRTLDTWSTYRDVRDGFEPLTYWNMARSWRGAYEGWMPSADAFFGHIDKKLHGLEGFYMAGQWVEPGGGVPTAVISGRQVVELICHDQQRSFSVPAVSGD